MSMVGGMIGAMMLQALALEEETQKHSSSSGMKPELPRRYGGYHEWKELKDDGETHLTFRDWRHGLPEPKTEEERE